MEQKTLRVKKSLHICLILCMVISLAGCDAFVRKFTRKSKQDASQAQDLVLVPQDYSRPGLTGDELYRQYFLFWKSWQDELINSLLSGTNHKKQVGCAKEAIKNLEALKDLLTEEKQKEAQRHIDALAKLQEAIAGDAFATHATNNRNDAEHIKRNILRDLSYQRIKDYIRKR